MSLFSSVNGCDSLVVIDLTIHKSTEFNLQVTACDSFILNNETFFTSGTYTQSLSNTEGCDSLLTLVLKIINIDGSLTHSGANLSSNESGANYEWVRCDSGYAIIPDENSQTFTATSDGSYAVIIYRDGCVDTSECFTVILGSTFGIGNENNIRMFPNPASDVLYLSSEQNLHQVNISIKESSGKLLKENRNQNGKLIPIDISELISGIYFVELRDGKKFHRFKLVKI